MKKYTVKELTKIQGLHDVIHCNIPACPTCRAYHAYAMKLATQGEVMDRVNNGSKVAAIADDLCMSDATVQAIINACTGKTAAAVHMNQYQGTLAGLIKQGFSIPAIAKILGKTTVAIAMYLKTYCMAKPEVTHLRIDKVKATAGYRYFDQRGIEYTVRRKRGSK